jgi:hypothetical protein
MLIPVLWQVVYPPHLEISLVALFAMTAFHSLYAGGFFEAALPDASPLLSPSPYYERLGFLLSLAG